MGNATGAKKCKPIFVDGEVYGMATKTHKTAENDSESTKAEKNTTADEKTQETANTKAIESTFIYVGPTLRTGIRENAMFKGTKENVEAYLKPTIDKYPQVKLLLVDTKRLSTAKEKVNKAGTLLNKYYNDLVSLSNRR